MRYLLFVLLPFFFLASCVTDPQTKMVMENEMRSYERFKSELGRRGNDPGIYYKSGNFDIVISLTDSGTDRYQEWACDLLLTRLYGYRAVDQTLVSDNEFYTLALKFELTEVVEGEYENRARVSIRGKDVENFIKKYRKNR